MGDGTILDTHAAGRLYFGVQVDSMEAVKFAEDQIGVAEVLRFLKRNPDRLKPIIDEARKALTSPF
jgi:hypothetical protein